MKTFFCLFLLALMVHLTYAADPPLPTPVGRVIWIKGTLQAMMPNKERRLLQKMSVIYLSDTLVTDDMSQAQIAFTDNTLMTLRQSTQFHIDQYQFLPGRKKGSVGKYVMTLIEGGFRTITGLIAKQNPTDYEVNTPVATIGVRGTDYAVYVRNKELYMGYYSGSPCVTNQGGKLCLNAKTPYARVSGVNAKPEPLTTTPEVLKEKLEIVPAKIDLFSSVSSKGNPSSNNQNPNGTVSSFCIQ